MIIPTFQNQSIKKKKNPYRGYEEAIEKSHSRECGGRKYPQALALSLPKFIKT
ncbi:MAG: hypothetical protein H0U49_01595 [Parachlamydiaceae bacterium]|nr:hypothetical protein [Parachlamydiaceae bacterium]